MYPLGKPSKKKSESWDIVPTGGGGGSHRRGGMSQPTYLVTFCGEPPKTLFWCRDNCIL